MPKASQATWDVANQRPIQPNLRHGSRGGYGATGLTPRPLRHHNQQYVLQREVAADHLASIAEPTLDPVVNLDILRRFLLGSDGRGLVVSPSVETAHEGPKPEGALIVVGDPGEDEEDRVQELQRFIVAQPVQREK